MIHPYLGMIMNFQSPGVANPGYMSDLVKVYGESTPMSTPADENLFNIRESPQRRKDFTLLWLNNCT